MAMDFETLISEEDVLLNWLALKLKVQAMDRNLGQDPGWLSRREGFVWYFVQEATDYMKIVDFTLTLAEAFQSTPQAPKARVWSKAGFTRVYLPIGGYLTTSRGGDLDRRHVNEKLLTPPERQALRAVISEYVKRAEALRAVHRESDEALVASAMERLGTSTGLSGGSFNAEDVFGLHVEDYKPSPDSWYSEVGRDAHVRVGGKTFNVFHSAGVFKYVTLVGTKGRKSYLMQPVSHGRPLVVAVAEIIDHSKDIMADPLVVGEPTLVP